MPMMVTTRARERRSRPRTSAMLLRPLLRPLLRAGPHHAAPHHAGRSSWPAPRPGHHLPRCRCSGPAGTDAGAAVRVHGDVADALAAGRPVVALESTLIAHGMPFPHNLQTGRALEEAVRAAGAVPATIGRCAGRRRRRDGLSDAARPLLHPPD